MTKKQDKWQKISEQEPEELENSADTTESEESNPEAGAESGEGSATGIELESREEVLQELEKARAEAEKFRDAALRAQAEVENVRMRSKKDVESAHLYSTEKVVKELIPVVDSLEQSLSGEANNDPMAEGVKLTLDMLLKVLGSFGVNQINPIGEKFDPNVHEAISLQPTADAEEGVVLTVFQKGFVLKERVVRPARVIVSAKLEN